VELFFPPQAGEGKRVYDREDMAGASLFRFVREEVLQKPTYAAFYSLLDNFTAEQKVTEKVRNDPQSTDSVDVIVTPR
jgi:poly(U)-specific endoribonuclease